MFLPLYCKNGYSENAKNYIGNSDFVYVVGDAYVDHPSFGHSIISRILDAMGFSVSIISQPNYKDATDFKRFGKPKLGFIVTSGNIDSMVAHYTAAKKTRSNDAYTEGGISGQRPDRATIVYCNRIREAYGDVPIIIGGLEASLRRFAHYDYWDNRVRRSILFDSRADILIYGMGERQIAVIANHLKNGGKIRDLTEVEGTAYIAKTPVENTEEIPDFESVREDKMQYAISCKQQFQQQKVQSQRHFDRYLIVNLPPKPLNTQELDGVYSLPFERMYHPLYKDGVPGIKEVEFSIISSRGCFGACNFCSLAFHQGRYVTSRSQESIIAEGELIAKNPNFKGYIHDVGGPTANFRHPSCNKKEHCIDKQCLFPKPCKNLIVNHKEYLDLLTKLRHIEGVKKVFVRSGIRYDYLIYDKDDTFFKELCKHHVSGQLKVAPEHISDNVLQMMGKPSMDVYDRFSKKFYDINAKIDKKQFLVPYLISSHPGSRLSDAIMLAEYLRDNKINPEQVQDFYPTPGTVSTCMYYTEIDPRTMESVYVPKTYEEKQMQRALLQYKKRENYNLVYKALNQADRQDLIGFDDKALIRPKTEKSSQKSSQKSSKNPQFDAGKKSKGDVKSGKNTKWKGSFHKGKKSIENRGSRPKKSGH